MVTLEPECKNVCLGAVNYSDRLYRFHWIITYQSLTPCDTISS